MTRAQRLVVRLQEQIDNKQRRATELLHLEDSERTDEIRTEERSTFDELTDLRERRTRAEAEVEREAEASTTEHRQADGLDAEMRERIELRSRARVTNFLLCRARGQMPSGAEAELQAAAGVTDGGMPVEIFDVPETRADAVTSAPTTGTGVNLDPILPAIFARSVLPRLGVAMPRVESGTFATGTVTTSLSAGAMAKGAAREATAAEITTKTTTPHRVSTRLGLTVEDVATIGVGNFEAIIRQNAVLSQSAELDRLGLNGDGADANPQGLLSQLTDPDAPSAVLDFDGFVGLAAAGIDGGPWAETMEAVRLLVNAETMRLAEITFQAATSYRGELSAAAYLRSHSGMFFSSSRMPATASTIAQCLRYRAGTMGLGGVNAVRTATCPVYNSVAIDDIYSGSASGTRYFTIHALIGDILIVQPDAYERVDVKVAA